MNSAPQPLDTPPAGTPFKRRRFRRKLLVWAAILALLAWFVLPAERRELPFRAMPSNCIAIAETYGLAFRWRDRMSHPAILATLRLAGVEDPRGDIITPDLHLTLFLLTGRRAVGGYSPSLGPRGLPAFCGASYVGWRYRPMQFLKAIRYIPGLGPLERSEGGSLFLRLGHHPEPGDPVLALDLRDGILLATWSPDPDAVRSLSARLAQDAPPFAPALGGDTPWESPLRQPMRGWVAAIPDAEDGILPLPDILRCSSPAWSGGEIAVEAQSPSAAISSAIAGLLPDDVPLSFDSIPPMEGSCAPLEALPDDPPIAWLPLPRPALDPLLRSLRIRPPDARGDAFLALVSSAHGQKLLGLDTPAIVASLPWTKDESSTATDLAALLSPLPVRTAVSPTGGGRLSVTFPEIPLAKAAGLDLTAERRSGWLTLATSAAAQDNLRRAPVTGDASWRAFWREAATPPRAALCLWADCDALAREYGRIVSLANLAAAFGKDICEPDTLEFLNLLATALGDLAPAGDLRATLSSDAGHSRLRIAFAPHPE